MGNQCCAANNTTSEQPPLAPVRFDEPETEDQGEAILTQNNAQTNVHANVIEEVEEEAEQEVEIITPAVAEFKFKNQLEFLQLAMASVENFKSIANKGTQLSQAISETEDIIGLVSSSSHTTEYLRQFKVNVLSLYSNLQRFRTWNLRYTLDDSYSACLPVITDLLSLLRSVQETHSTNGKLNLDAFNRDLYSGDNHVAFETLLERFKTVTRQYNSIYHPEQLSRLPNYLFAAFNESPGFKLWEHLFPHTFELSNATFAEKYGQYCGVEAEKILTVISLLDSANDKRVDIYQWLEFVKEYINVLDGSGKIIPEKLDEFTIEIQAKAIAMKSAPEQISQGVYRLKSGLEYSGQLDEFNQKQGFGTLTGEGYSLSVNFVNDIAEGNGNETRKGIEYTGDFLNGLYHGFGVITFPNGRMYSGNFQSHQFEGEGQLLDEDGIRYNGEWKNGDLTYGQITYHDGSKYIGQILAHTLQKHGQGDFYVMRSTFSEPKLYISGIWQHDQPKSGKQYNNNETIMYDGEFKDWVISGHGQRIYVDGTYEGTFVADQKEGNGTLTYKAGDKFTGTWKNDSQVQGVYHYNKEATHLYDGEWHEGKMQGKGQFTYASGGFYQGDVQDGKRHGHGEYRYQNGNVYSGNWVNNIQEGEGKFTYSSAAPEEKGDVYQGQFKNGKFNGFGHYIYTKSGKNYIGFWEDDKWTGEGKFLDSNNDVIKAGVWNNDKISQEKPVDTLVFPQNLKHLIIQRASS